jgi:N-acetylmuramic acid 6-phosphate etherase
VQALHREDARALRAVQKAGAGLARVAERLTQTLRRGGRLIYVGAGTSGRLGVLDAVELPPTFGLEPSRARALIAGGRRALVRAVEGAEDDEGSAIRDLRRLRVSSLDLVVGISASGATPYVLAALREAGQRGAQTVLLSCRPPPARVAVDERLTLKTGTELIPGSTRLKAGTATKLALNALSTAALVRLGRVYRGQMVDLKATNQKLRERALTLVAALARVSRPRARRLLAQAGGSARLALALHFTGLSLPSARRLLRTQGLRALESHSTGHLKGPLL